MRKIFFMLALALASTAAMAQSTRIIKGAVVDKNGNPLPGATVEATNGAESTTVDADGTFSLEVSRWLNTATARYAGMRKKTLKVQDGDMVFRLSPDVQNCWFVNAVGGLAILDSGGDYYDLIDDYTYTIGVMGGYLGKWGGYAKLLWTPDSETAVPVVTVGATKRVFPFMHAYAGAGYANVTWKADYKEVITYNDNAAAFDLGAIFLIGNRFTANVGMSWVSDFSSNNYFFQAGIGYAF